MKLWKKIILIFFVVLLLVQIPFVYRRIKKGNLAQKISNLAAQRSEERANPKFNEYKGVIHVHSFIGGHSTGTFDELIKGAGEANLDFVVMTEHTSALYDTSAMTLQGARGGVLFVGGNEANTKQDERFLILNGFAEASLSRESQTPDFLEKAHAANKLAFITYPENFNSWNGDFDGIEIFSLFTNAKQGNAPFFLLDAFWSFGAYPELTLADYFKRPDENLHKFDAVTVNKKSTLFAGSDAHSNIGFHLFGDDAGHKFVNFKLDRYATIFRLVRTHVLLEKEKSLTQETLLDALKNGRAFIGFDVLSDTGGFNFTAENASGERKTMGDEIFLTDEGVNFKVAASQSAHFIVFKNGEKFFEENGNTEINFNARERGTYRVEVYLHTLGASFDQTPWIISNPIYVK
ncbi:MAG: hypothetical protein H0U87_06165 [Acidobacteria bacterium]|nr:hypothetical protein [Acidobacteriota bacterium]